MVFNLKEEIVINKFKQSHQKALLLKFLFYKLLMKEFGDLQKLSKAYKRTY